MGAINSVASAIPALTNTLGAVAQTVGTVQTLAGKNPAVRSQEREQELALEQLQQRQQIQQKQLEQDTALERERMALEGKQADEQRQAALRRAVARQRAQFGASGVGGGSGSSQAVLLGLFEESDEERAQQEKIDNLRSRALDNDLFSSQSVNVLQREQLRQRQDLQRSLSSFGRLF